MRRCLFHYVVFIATLLVSVAAPTKAAMTLPESISGLRAAQQRYLPAKELRGYGKVEGQCAEFAAADKSRASVLLIKCDDASRAALTLGKYRSDLASLGGVSNATIAVGHNSLPIVRVEGQGAVAALREDTQVAIVAAQQERDLVVLLAALGVGRQTRFDFVGGDVPMYLDRYDKYGWHFYFNPWSKPQNQPNYDLDDSFQYLSRNGFGMMMPLSLNNIDSTEAVIEYANLAWAIERGRELSIPTFIQAWAIGAPRMLINRHPFDTMLKMPQFVGNFYGPGENGGGYPPEVAWSSEKAEDRLLNWLQPIYRRYHLAWSRSPERREGVICPRLARKGLSGPSLYWRPACRHPERLYQQSERLFLLRPTWPPPPHDAQSLAEVG